MSLPLIEKNTKDTVDGVNKSNIKLDDLNKSSDKQNTLLENYITDLKNQQTRNALLENNRSSSQQSGGGALSGVGAAASGIGSGIGGILGGIGGFASGIGIGGGALMAGVGILAAGGGYFLEQLNSFDGKKIRANVNELFGIADDAGGLGNFFAEGGTFALIMSGIGIGLGIFAAGGAASAALEKFDGDGAWVDNTKATVKKLLSLSDEIDESKLAILGKGGTFFATLSGLGVGLGIFGVGGAAAAALTKFESGDWASKVKDQVKTLLEIPDLPNAGLGGAATFIATMGGLAVGLAAFALGKGAEGIVSVGTEGLEKFTGEPFAERVKSEVETLLSIPSLPNATLGSVAGFIGVMGGLAAGLAAFALGKGAEGVAEVGQEGLSFFTSQPGFAERVKSEVEALLSIPSLPNATLGDVAGFIGVMGGIATGLMAFSTAKGISGAITFFTGGEAFAEGVKKEVDTLLSITNNLKDDGSMFNAAMGNIATGLLKFSGGEFGASFVGVGTSILNFLSGEESPIQKVLSIAENADKLTQGANALGAIADNLNKFGAINFDGDKFNIKGFANDLKEAVPIIEGAIMGDNGGWFGKKIFGLASPEIDYKKAAESIDVLRTALKVEAVAGQAASGGAGAASSVINNYITNNYTTNNTTSGGGGGTTIMGVPAQIGGERPDVR